MGTSTREGKETSWTCLPYLSLLVVSQCVQESCSSYQSSGPRKKHLKKLLPSRGKQMRRRKTRGRTRKKMLTKKLKTGETRRKEKKRKNLTTWTTEKKRPW